MSAPWGGPPPPDRRGYQDFIGRPVLTIVGGVRHNVPSQWGARDLPHVTIVSLVGPDAGVVYTDIIVFTSRIAGRLKASEPGAVVLSKVVDKGKAPDLDDPDQWDQQAATAWFNANPGALDALKHGAMTDFHNFLNRDNGNGQAAVHGGPAYGQNPAYMQQQYAPNPAYAQAPAQVQVAPQANPYAQAQVQQGYPQAPQQGYQAPGPDHQAQLREAVAPPPPQAPPPAYYGPPPEQAPQQSATLASMTAPANVDASRVTQSEQAPF